MGKKATCVPGDSLSMVRYPWFSDEFILVAVSQMGILFGLGLVRFETRFLEDIR